MSRHNRNQTTDNATQPLPNTGQDAPWYRHFWVWVIIALPMTAVVLGGVLVYFSITRPDPLVINSAEYDAIVRGLRAQSEQTLDPVPPADASKSAKTVEDSPQ